jgi:hypothetical protein
VPSQSLNSSYEILALNSPAANYTRDYPSSSCIQPRFVPASVPLAAAAEPSGAPRVPDILDTNVASASSRRKGLSVAPSICQGNQRAGSRDERVALGGGGRGLRSRAEVEGIDVRTCAGLRGSRSCIATAYEQTATFVCAFPSIVPQDAPGLTGTLPRTRD